MMKPVIVSAIATLMSISAVSALQHDHHNAQPKDVTITGEVIDTVCYLSHDSRGKEHAACAKYCAEQGIPLGILEEGTNKVYVSLPVDHTNPNTKLMDFIAQRVKVTGTVFTKGGLTGLHVKKVEPAGK